MIKNLGIELINKVKFLKQKIKDDDKSMAILLRLMRIPLMRSLMTLSLGLVIIMRIKRNPGVYVSQNWVLFYDKYGRSSRYDLY